MHIRHKDGKALKRGENDELEYKMNTWAVVAASRGEAFPLIDDWRWMVHSVEVKCPSMTEAKNLADFLKGKDYLVETHAEYEHSRVVLHHYIGCVSETMKMVNDDGFRALIEMERKRRKYDGRFEFFRRVTDLQRGALIELVVEEKLVECFETDGATLRLGTSGLVAFENRTAKKKAGREEKMLEETKRQLEELEARKIELQRTIANQEAAKQAEANTGGLEGLDLQETNEEAEAESKRTSGALSPTGSGTGAESQFTAKEIQEWQEEAARVQEAVRKEVEEALAKMQEAGTNANIRNIGKETEMEADQEVAQGAKAKTV